MNLIGTLCYNKEKELWFGKGEGWWLSQIMENRVKVHFEDLFSINEADKYHISVESTKLDYEIQNVTMEGFELVSLGSGSEIYSYTFTVVGKLVTHSYDDRNLTNEESIEDIYSASLLLKHQIPYGFVSVMGSASIQSKEKLLDKKERISDINYRLMGVMNKNDSVLSKKFLTSQIDINKIKLDRQDVISAKSSKYYESAVKFGELWGTYCANEQKEALNGCHVPVCTGGGPGIMEAVAKGASSKNANVIGIDCQFVPDDYFDTSKSCYQYSNIRLRLNNFAIREGVLINNSNVILFWPGGYGTTWEVCEVLSKLQTHHLRKRKIKAIFVHTEFWTPFFKFVDSMREFGTVNSTTDRIKIPGVDDDMPDDYYIAEAVDSAEEAFKIAKTFVEKLAKDNYLIANQD